jgi:hypothetical protein
MDQIDVYRQIRRKRNTRICGRVEQPFSTVGSAASSFGLDCNDYHYREIAKNEAILILTALLWKDMAYGSKIMGFQQARELAKRFINQDGNRSKIYTNSDWSNNEEGEYVLRSWSPGSGATFNAGIIILSPDSVACVWIEDED